MKHFTHYLLLISLAVIFSCEQKKRIYIPSLTVNTRLLDSIKQHSDSTYSKPYRRTDFVTAEYFISKKDSTTTQLMKDGSGAIRLFVIEKNKRRIYVAEFYPNGQQQYKTNLDAYGQYDGRAEAFYPNGSLKRTGVYKNGLHTGKWKNYNEEGNYASTDEYDGNGQLVRRYKE